MCTYCWVEVIEAGDSVEYMSGDTWVVWVRRIYIYIIFNIWYIFIYGSLHICMILKDTACSSDAARMFFAKMFERYDPLSTPGRLFFCYEGDCCVEDSTDCHQAGFLPKKHTHTQGFCNKSDHASTSVNNGCGSSQNAEYNTDERLFTRKTLNINTNRGCLNEKLSIVLFFPFVSF